MARTAVITSSGVSAARATGPPPPSGPVTEAAIVGYFQQAFPDAIAASTIQLDWGSAGVSAEVIEELGILGIDDMGEVAALVPADFAAVRDFLSR